MAVKKVGVLLSGCGVQDGSEIHEAVFTLYFLDKAGVEIICIAPHIWQTRVTDHISGEQVQEKRSVLQESARIARGNIRSIKTVNANELDAIIIPGGYGAALNLCTFANDGIKCTVNLEVERLLREIHKQGKPIGAACIAPVLIARIFGPDFHPQVTIGTDETVAKAINEMGATHVQTRVDEVCVDKTNKIVTTPAYMLASSISEVATGIEKLVKQTLKLI
jgi:enhancing lycopene biosynthesis protein 2